MAFSETISGLVIAGTNSGSGKTTVTLALLAALAARKRRIAAFKCGPDYIDPLFHRQAAGTASCNLDTFMMGEEGVKAAFRRCAAGCDVAVVEGVMGLFDGNLPGRLDGSTAEIARLLGLPVVLVVNARGLAGSIAPLVRGFAEWHPDVRIAGVIANCVGSERHAGLLAEALALAQLPPLLGALRRDEALSLPERHLGLATEADLSDRLGLLSARAEAEIDLERLLQATRVPMPQALPAPPAKRSGVRLGVALDEAFQFYYPDNLARLEQAGAEIVPFSPLSDRGLPENLQGLYLGGGFPELHAERLAANAPLLEAVRAFPGWIYGECGGYLYLLEELALDDGRVFPLAGLLPGKARMNRRLANLGYRTLTTRRESLFGPAGTVLLGHEFHYSSADVPEEDALFAAVNLKGEAAPAAAGQARGRIAGGYAHLHLASNPGAADAWIGRLSS